MPELYEISKSKYCRGFQCPKILWLERNKPEEAQETASENILENGNRVGLLAQQYFGEHSVVGFSFDKSEMAAETQRLIESGTENICEAAFLVDGLYCAVDILHKNGDGWDIVEVKSSTKLSDIYIEDMAFQFYVLTRSGIKVNRVINMHLNSFYVRQGDLDLKGLFRLEDCTEAVTGRSEEVEKLIPVIRAAASSAEEPVRDLDLYCESPYKCAFWGYCSRELPEHNIFGVSGMQTKTRFRHYKNGIVSFEDMLENAKKLKLSEKVRRQIESVTENRPDQINREKITEFLKTLSYPLYHLDFETYQQPIPEYDGVSPYQQIPFQYSLHIEQADGSLEHREFLAKEGTDPRRELAQRLVEDIPPGVCSLAYNMTFEKTVIRRLAETFPDLEKRLMDIHDNMHDLMIPFKDQDYYSTAMQGSYSIKYVLPALYPDDPELDYHNLRGIHNGGEASASFAALAERSPEEIAATREDLLKYCGLDTYAMVKVLRKLKEAAE